MSNSRIWRSRAVNLVKRPSGSAPVDELGSALSDSNKPEPRPLNITSPPTTPQSRPRKRSSPRLLRTPYPCAPARNASSTSFASPEDANTITRTSQSVLASFLMVSTLWAPPMRTPINKMTGAFSTAIFKALSASVTLPTNSNSFHSLIRAPIPSTKSRSSSATTTRTTFGCI